MLLQPAGTDVPLSGISGMFYLDSGRKQTVGLPVKFSMY